MMHQDLSFTPLFQCSIIQAHFKVTSVAVLLFPEKLIPDSHGGFWYMQSPKIWLKVLMCISNTHRSSNDCELRQSWVGIKKIYTNFMDKFIESSACMCESVLDNHTDINVEVRGFDRIVPAISCNFFDSWQCGEYWLHLNQEFPFLRLIL